MAASNLAGPGAGLTNLKLKYFAAAVLDSLPYIRLSRSYFKDDVKGKKAGMTYKFYVPDPGIAEAGTADLNVAGMNGDVWELPVSITLVEGKTKVNLNDWNKLTAIEDFVRDIAEPHGRTLGASIEKKIIEQNVFRADSAIVDKSGTPSTKVFALLAGKLRAIRAAGTKVGFAHPDVFAALGDALLGKFLPSEVMKKIYGDTVIAHAFGSEWIEENYMPFVTFAGTETITAVNFSTGVVTGTGLFNGLPFTVTGGDGNKVKTVDLNGIQTNEDFVFIVTDVNAAGTSGKLQIDAEALRFMNGPTSDTVATIKDYSNPTIGYKRYASDGTDYLGTLGSSSGNFSVTMLFNADGVTSNAAGTYAIVQVRDRDALEFDSYEFPDVEGAKNGKMKAAEINVQTAEQGNIADRTSIMRVDVPYMAKLVLTKLARVAYIKVA
jgi:hypothetical protein